MFSFTKYKVLGLFLANLLLVTPLVAQHNFSLPAIFSSHAVLQRGKPIALHGYGHPGAQVTATFDHQTQTATIDANGRWEVMFKAHEAGGPYSLTVSSGKESIHLADLLVGDVWLASGQSNMRFTMEPEPPWTEGVLNYKQEIAAANYPKVRFFMVPPEAEFPKKQEEEGTWEVTSPDTACHFSGVAYYFATEVFRRTGIPIGILSASVGGIPIDAAMDASHIDPRELTSDANKRAAAADKVAAYQQKISSYYTASRQALSCKVSAKAAYLPDPYPNYIYSASGVYNAMIYPLRTFPIRGFIWYQGESDTKHYETYEARMQQLIDNWRTDWKDPNLPFYYVQIANRDFHSAQAADPGFVYGRSGKLRFQQFKALTIPHTGMAVAADVGDPQTIHPRDKKTVGVRLALQALSKTYGLTDVIADGPLYSSFDVKGDKLILHFVTNGSPMVNRTGSAEPDGFEIAGADGKFYAAISKMQGDTVMLRSPSVKSPVSARYGAGDDPRLSLYNAAGLPTPTFETQ